MTITRYTDGGPEGWMQSPTGEFVRFEDHEAEVARLVPLKGGVPVREWALQENLKLAEEGLANYAQEVEGLKATLRRIEQERLTWAMSCECYCPACTTFDKLLRRAEPQTCRTPEEG